MENVNNRTMFYHDKSQSLFFLLWWNRLLWNCVMWRSRENNFNLTAWLIANLFLKYPLQLVHFTQQVNIHRRTQMRENLFASKRTIPWVKKYLPSMFIQGQYFPAVARQVKSEIFNFLFCFAENPLNCVEWSVQAKTTSISGFERWIQREYRLCWKKAWTNWSTAMCRTTS